MKKIILIILVFISCAPISFGQSKNLNTDLIPDSLMQRADAVLRFSTTTYERHSASSYSMHIHKAVTVLNKNGASAARLRIYYDNNSDVRQIKGIFYSAQGREISKLKSKNIRDYASNNSYTLFSDQRVKTFSPASNNYPYTVEYSYTVDYHETAGLPIWMPIEMYNLSVEEAELNVLVSEKLDINYLSLNNDFSFRLEQDGKDKKYQWHAHQLKAMVYERNSPNFLDFMPCVLLTPKTISYEGHKGDFSNWNNYGRWGYELIEDRGVLSDESIMEIQALTDTIPLRIDKIKAVYQYMQNKTRYINITLGIGGFQPIEAKDVDSKGYGDCKALSNYTKALLESIGIESFYTEIGSGEQKEIKFPEFASANQTNHIILCVPNKKDSIWLECTNQNIPFGYIGSSNLNRYALLLTEKGGILAKTPNYTAEENSSSATITIEINESGNAEYTLKRSYKNYLFEEVFPMLPLSQKEQKKHLLSNIEVDGLNINDFQLQDISNKTAIAILEIKGSINKMAKISGNRMFFTPELFRLDPLPTFIPESRKQNIFQSQSFSKTDSITIIIPEEFDFEHIPENISLTSVFGDYSRSFIRMDNMLTMIRKLKIHHGNYVPAQFTEMNAFLQNVNRSDEEKLIAKKK